MQDYGTKSGVIQPGDINTSQRLVSGMMSTIDVDDIGDVVIPSGIRFTDHFRSFKSVNLDHDLTKPIGTHRNHEVKDRGVRVTWHCSKSALGEDVWIMINEGVIRGMSLHWDRRGVKARKATADDVKQYGSGAKRVIEEWPLVTYAATAVAMNPYTVIDDVKHRHNELDRLVRLGRIKMESAVAAGLPVRPAVERKLLGPSGVWRWPARA